MDNISMLGQYNQNFSLISKKSPSWSIMKSEKLKKNLDKNSNIPTKLMYVVVLI